MEITKISDNEIKVVKEETTTKEETHTFEFLTSQKKAIEEMRDRDNLQREKELTEVNELLAECDKLGVSAKPTEEITN